MMEGHADSAVRSYDVFDTTVVRLLFRPRDVLHRVGLRLRASGLCTEPEAWVTQRISIERIARSEWKGGEISLDGIYDALATVLGWSVDQRIHASKIEFETELQMIRPVQTLLAEIQGHKAAGTRCIFISDTYFSSRQIAEFLGAIGLPTDTADVFTSSDKSASKWKGDIYGFVARELRPSRIAVHSGDNRNADVIQARRSGISARFVNITAPNRYERLLSKRRSLQSTLPGAAVAGASRVARLASRHQDPRLRAFWDTGANVMGPLLASYVLHVLLDARARGLNRLYFVARDGWIMREVAVRLQSWLGPGPELRYLYGSRQAWHSPTLAGTDDPPSWLMENVETLSLQAVLARLDLEWEDCAVECRRAGFELDDLLQPVGTNKRISSLLADKEFSRKVGERSSEAARRVVGYLRQEGLLKDGNWALVDIGWQGRMQESLEAVLTTSGKPVAPTGYYLGLSRRARHLVEPQAWAYARERLRRFSMALHGNRTLTEVMCAAPHATTVRYLDCGAEVMPQFATTADGVIPELDQQREGILKFASCLSEACVAIAASPAEIRDLMDASARECWVRFASRPSRIEAMAYGSLLYSHEQGANQNLVYDGSIAPVIGPVSIMGMLLKGPRQIARLTWWPHGTATASLPHPFSWGVCLLLDLRQSIAHLVADMLVALERARGKVR